jgi:DNA-binding response OmpR family regulator
MKKRILVVEDDASLGRVIVDNLGFEGFDAQIAVDGAAALRLASEYRPDLVILDVALPDRSGFDLFEPISRGGQNPVIFLTARGQKIDKLKGLALGADDYVTKPFDLEELLARVHAVLRRTRTSPGRLVLGDVVVDFQLQRADKAGVPLNLTHRELELLRYLAERRDNVVHRDELLKHVWGYGDTPITRSVDHAIARLRRKIESDPHRPRFIHTVHGDGYRLTVETGAANGSL